MGVKTQARTVVLHDGKVLLLRCAYPDGEYWVLPGGKQEFGETIEECAVRETKEETNLTVSLKRPLYVQEVLQPKKQSLALVFLASPSGELTPTHLNDPDLDETKIVGVEWVPVERLSSLALRQAEVMQQLLHDLQHGWPVGILQMPAVRR